MKPFPPGTHRVPIGVRRSYLLHVPPGRGPFPMVMMLHGAGGTAEFAAEETGWSPFADERGFVVVYPEGVAADPGKEPKFLTNPQEWNDGSGRGRADDVVFLTDVLGDLPAWVNVDLGRVLLTGFSNGAGMVFKYAAAEPTRVRAIAPVAGHCWGTPPTVPPIPTLYMIGDADPILPLTGGTARTPWGKLPDRPAVADTLAKWSAAIGTPVNGPTFPVRIVTGHGHHWPGGQAKLGEKLGGPVSGEVDATRLIWAFFENI